MSNRRSNNVSCQMSLLLTFYCLSFAFAKSVKPFRLRTITQFSFDDSKIGVLFSEDGSDIDCGAKCLKSKLNCAAFKVVGDQCFLLRSWSFAEEPEPSSKGIKVFEVNPRAWSKIMILGGRTLSSDAISDVEVIDLANAVHCPNPTPLPNPRFAMQSFVLGSKLLTVGGNQLDITSYNYEDQIWESLGSLGAQWLDYSLGRIRDSWVLLMGGRYDGIKTNMTMVLIANGSLHRGPDLPTPNLGFCACGLDDNHIFIAGGKDLNSKLRKAYALDWKTQQWIGLNNQTMVFARQFVECGTFLNSKHEVNVLVVSGIHTLSFTDPSTEIYDWPLRIWRRGPHFIFPNIYLTRLYKFDDKLFVFGGYDEDGGTYLNEIYTFIPANESWVRFPVDLNIARRHFAIMMIPDEIANC